MDDLNSKQDAYRSWWPSQSSALSVMLNITVLPGNLDHVSRVLALIYIAPDLPEHPLCIAQREVPPGVIQMFWWGNPLLEVSVFCRDLLSSVSHHDHQVWYLCSPFYPEASALEHFHTRSTSSAASRPTVPPAGDSAIASAEALHKLRNLSQKPYVSRSNNSKSNRVNATVNNWKVKQKKHHRGREEKNLIKTSYLTAVEENSLKNPTTLETRWSIYIVFLPRKNSYIYIFSLVILMTYM